MTIPRMLSAAAMTYLSVGCGDVKSADVHDDAGVSSDATMPSDAQIELTLSQTNSSAITSGVGCRTSPANYIVENNLYRGFKLADYGVTGGFHVKKVNFGIASAKAGGSAQTQPAEISVYAYAGPVGSDTIDLSKLTKQADVMIQIPDTATAMPIEIPVDADIPDGTAGLVVQFHVSDGQAAMNQIMIGANQQGEKAPAYELSPLCGQTSPVTFPSAGLSNFALVLTVTGDRH